MSLARFVLRILPIFLPFSTGWCLARSPADVLRTMHGPEGFSIEVAAEPPIVRHPMWACFNERGRLFVAESGGLNLNADALLKDPPSSILLLEDTKGDGHFDKSSVFADKMVFPQGVCWHDGALYVASPPYLWRLRDTKGTGIADERTPIVRQFGFTGNAADIHGPVLGPDGRLYWCDGRHGHEIKMPDGTMSKGLAACVFRCKPDGSDVEIVCGGGMDNPVQVTFTEEGEPLVSCNIVHSQPQRIDGILYGLEGAVFPWNEVLNEFKSTGEWFEPVDPLGWVAVSGLVRYRGESFGRDFRDNLFTAQFNPHRVQRHIVERDGAGFRIRHEDFLTCTDPDFHPTAVVEDADGSLLVIDTGGWFQIGCPTSRIAKPEINGAIYRIRRKDASIVDDPRGLAIDWNTIAPTRLASLLNDPRPEVLERAIDWLAHRSPNAVDTLAQVLQKDASVASRRNAIWALCQMDTPSAQPAARIGLSDADPSVRQVAAQVAGLWRNRSAIDSLTHLLKDNSLPVRRDAATALGRIGLPAATPALIEALRNNSDRYLEHAIIYALVRIGDVRPLDSALDDRDESVRRGALLALDQIDGSGLNAIEVLPVLDPSRPLLKSAALSVIARHPGWGEQTRLFFRDALLPPIDPAQEDVLRQELVSFSENPAIQQVIVDALRRSGAEPRKQQLLLQVIAQFPTRPLAAAWIEPIRQAITSDDEAVAREAVLCAQAAGLTDVDSQLLHVATDAKRSESLRIEAFSVSAPRVSEVNPSLFDLLIAGMKPDRAPLLRAEAAAALGRSDLSDQQLNLLAQAVSTSGPMELPKLLPAFGRRTCDAGGESLLQALEHSPGLTSLRPEDLKAALAKDSPQVQSLAEPFLKRLAPDAERQKAHLAELAPVLSGGDIGRGRELFVGPRAGCAVCHTIAGHGGQVGPDLSKIGSIRTASDLLESIVYPSASFARGYEPYLVRTKDGDTQAGIISRETADSIYLTTGPRQILRIPRQSIALLRPGTVSLMPQGFDEQLSRGELADLIAYLTSLK